MYDHDHHILISSYKTCYISIFIIITQKHWTTVNPFVLYKTLLWVSVFVEWMASILILFIQMLSIMLIMMIIVSKWAQVRYVPGPCTLLSILFLSHVIGCISVCIILHYITDRLDHEISMPSQAPVWLCFLYSFIPYCHPVIFIYFMINIVLCPVK
jgi:hypothetical protein